MTNLLDPSMNSNINQNSNRSGELRTGSGATEDRNNNNNLSSNDVMNIAAQSQSLRRGSMRANLSQANLFHPISFRGTEMF